MLDLAVEATSLVENFQGVFRIKLAVVKSNLMGPQQHDPGRLRNAQMILIKLDLCRVNLPDIVHRVPCCQESDGQYGQEYHDKIG